MAKLTLRSISKQYPGAKVPVLNDISVDIDAGEFVVIVGPSGCGKSTLLRMVAGLESIEQGEILVGERVVNRLEPKERDIAMVFQNYALYPHMSVADNMSYALKIRGMAKQQIAERVARVAGILELTHLLGRKPRELSGGQRQRVAMGRAIVREPAVFLFDEPLSNLDAKLRGQMRLEIQRLHRRLATTSLYVTHDQVEAMTLADRVIVLNGGRIEQIGTPEQIYDTPATAFVAGFMGAPAMNLCAGRIAADGMAVQIGEDVALALPAAQPELAGQPVRVGIRPEHLGSAAHCATRLTMQVDSTEMLGADNYAYGSVAGEAMVARLPHGQRPQSGSRIELAVAGAHLHLFEVDSGRRIAVARPAAVAA